MSEHNFSRREYFLEGVVPTMAVVGLFVGAVTDFALGLLVAAVGIGGIGAIVLADSWAGHNRRRRALLWTIPLVYFGVLVSTRRRLPGRDK